MAPTFALSDSHRAEVGGSTVERLLPRRVRRTIGAWCFLDHFGPRSVTADTEMMVGPHPHIGLQTVTWLIEGEAVHTDSLGSEQPIRPGQLNLMTAGSGIAHAEDSRGRGLTSMHGVQLWVAQPEATRHGPPSFEHHADLSRLDLGGGTGTVLVGAVEGTRSTARADTPLLGVDLDISGPITVPLDAALEHGVAVLTGRALVDGNPVAANEVGYLGDGRSEVTVAPVDGPVRALLLGGEPFTEDLYMWWNFVARSREEVETAYRDWQEHHPRFGPDVHSTLTRIPAPRPNWLPA